MDDCRNTDNAWVENTVLNIHLDRTSQVMVDINNMVSALLFCCFKICRAVIILLLLQVNFPGVALIKFYLISYLKELG